jgi:hypothetical protein
MGGALLSLVASTAGAGSAYLPVSEIFPMETRAMGIVSFQAGGTAAGGVFGPLLFARLTESGVPAHPGGRPRGCDLA